MTNVADYDIEQFLEMEEFGNYGVSFFNEDSDTEEIEDWLNDINELQRESSSRNVLGCMQPWSENSHDFHHAERQTPNTRHQQDLFENSRLISSMVAAGNLSSGLVQSTTLFNSNTSPTLLHQATIFPSHQTISQQRDDKFSAMSRPDQRPTEDSPNLQFDDDAGYQFPQSVFNSTEEEEDFLEEIQKEIGRISAERSDEPSQSPGKSYVGPEITNQHIVPPSSTSRISGESVPTVRGDSQKQPNAQSTSDMTTQDTQTSPNPTVPALLYSSKKSDDKQQTYQTVSKAQSNIQQSPTQRYACTYQNHDAQTTALCLSSSNRAKLQNMAAQIDYSSDPLLPALLRNAPGVDLSEPRLTDRCRGMQYVPFRQREELNRLHSDHNTSMREVNVRLRAAIGRRLGSTEVKSADMDAKISTIENFLFVKAIYVLRFHFPDNGELFADLRTWNRETAQLTLLHRLLQLVDLAIRPNGPVHIQNSLDAWYVAALNWQREIHDDWIDELETGRKRKAPDDEDDDEDNGNYGEGHPAKKTRKDESGKTNERPTRKPGRPPGSLNKSTIAAKLKQAAKAKDEERPKRISSLPEPTREDIQLARASATRYARQRSDSAPGPAVLSSPRINAAAPASANAAAQFPHQLAQIRGHIQGRYQPQPWQLSQSQFQAGRFPQAMPHFVQLIPNSYNAPSTSTLPPHFVHYQPAIPYQRMQHQTQQSQPRSQSTSQIPLSPNLTQPHIRPAQYSSFSSHLQRPPPTQTPGQLQFYAYQPQTQQTQQTLPQPTTQQCMYPPPPQLQQIYQLPPWTTPVPHTSTSMHTSANSILNFTNNTHNLLPSKTEQSSNNNNEDDDNSDDDLRLDNDRVRDLFQG